MNMSERIDILKQRIDEELYLYFQGKKPHILYEPMSYTVTAGGKRIRPLFVILACQSVGGCIEDCIHAALAVEILHTFTLVHDDIMDHDDMRRGKPTVHKKWDESTAILAGDGLVTEAYRMLLKTEHACLKLVLQKFTDGLLVLCIGQALDKMFETQDSISIANYEDMINKKTTMLIEVACEIGAILGNGTEEEQLVLKGFAHCLGKAFQIQDDLMDIFSEEKILGKKCGSDLIEKKKTYPTLYFLNHSSSLSKERFQKLWKKEGFGDEEVLEVRRLFDQEGIFESTRGVIRKLIAQSVECLNKLKSSEPREDLKMLAFMIQDRVA
ncbi:polyprenyl synthetase family protein [bacterium]|nr:polyprenyl synthetase family protein [bacterium]